MLKRVVVTGIGAVSPLGNDVDTLWGNLLKGKSGVDYITNLDTENLGVKIAGQVKDFRPEEYIEPKEAKRMSRFIHFAIAASKMAMDDAKLVIGEHVQPERIGVWIGSGIGGIDEFERQHKRFLQRGPRRVSPFTIPMFIPDMAAGRVSIELGAKGINNCSVTACASGANAIGDAYRTIKNGVADVIIAGGSEAAITEMTIAGFHNMTALSTNEDPQKASRPFDKNRDGFVLGEGAGIVILEELEHALNRGAKIYGEVIGYGATGDAHHITAPAPDGEGGARAMQAALEEGNVEPNEVQYINAHGTSTPFNDLFETRAIKTVFSDHAYELSVNSTKSMTGHLLGAAGALEAVITLLAMNNNVVPPTINYETKDDELDLDYVPNEAREKEVNIALSNSFGFGGHNASLLFKKYEA